MPRFTLIEFDRYVASRSKVSYHNMETTNLKEAFKEVLANLWEEEVQAFEWEWDKINQWEEDKIGLDMEEESYLFFEG
jgi:hypothetical protein